VYKKFFQGDHLQASLIGAPTSFTVDVIGSNENLASFEAEIGWEFFKGGSLSAIYTGEFGSGYIANQIILRLGKKF
jgi:hypothetical protein